MLLIFNGCSRKAHPSENTATTATSVKSGPVKKMKTVVPKVIVVSDSVASKTFDGRYYYDLEGHRYWRNNKDGKYYLFNKSMTDNPAFIKP